MFIDMAGNEIRIGDVVSPTEGRSVRIVSEGFSAQAGEEVLYGQQLEDMDAFSILTAENLAKQFRKEMEG
jgi:hypothetical protein